MKKIFAAITSLCVVLTFAACTNNTQPAPNTNTSTMPASSQAVSTPVASNPASTATSTAASSTSMDDSTSADTSGQPGFMGEWEIKDVGYMGVTFTLSQLESMVGMASGLDAALADNFTAEDIQEALTAFENMRATFEADGTGTITHTGSTSNMEDMPFTWSQTDGNYEITLNGQTAPLTYNTDGTLTFTYMDFEVNFSQVA